MRVTFAGEGLAPALKALWKECFGDPDSYVDFYFANRFLPEQTLVALEGDEPRAMLTLLPASLRLGGRPRPVSYVYAVATARACRGQGVSTALLAEAERLCRARGDAMTLLVPATGELHGFYAKRGYHPAFALKTVRFSAEELAMVDTNGIEIDEISALEYKRLRDARFGREGYLCWDERAVAYALAENRETGGFSCKIFSNAGQGAALCTTIEHTIFFREAALPDALLPAAAAALALRTGCTAAMARVPAASGLPGELRPYGMTSVPLGVEGGYLNLALD